jgi:hypothetical protein
MYPTGVDLKSSLKLILYIEVVRDRFVLSTPHVNKILLLLKLAPGDSSTNQ